VTGSTAKVIARSFDNTAVCAFGRVSCSESEKDETQNKQYIQTIFGTIKKGIGS